MRCECAGFCNLLANAPLYLCQRVIARAHKLMQMPRHPQHERMQMVRATVRDSVAAFVARNLQVAKAWPVLPQRFAQNLAHCATAAAAVERALYGKDGVPPSHSVDGQRARVMRVASDFFKQLEQELVAPAPA